MCGTLAASATSRRNYEQSTCSSDEDTQVCVMVDTAIFLGAGASKAEGAPLQGELFRDYFASPAFKASQDEMDRELATFFAFMFQIDVDNGDIPNIKFP